MRRPWWQRPWMLFWVAFGVRVAVIVIGHTYRIRTDQANFNFGFEAGRIGRSLAMGQGYSNPFNGESGPTAWLPPLYPLLIAAAFKVFGIYTRGAAFALLVCNSLFSAAIVPAVYEIAARCFDATGIARRSSKLAEPVAVWSAWMWAVYPAALQYAIHWIWEMSLSTCLFTWALVLALRLRGIGQDSRASHPAFGTWAAFGALWGLVALSNASLMLCLPAVMLWILWPRFRNPARLLTPIAGAALASLVVAAVMAPWVIRNQRTLHAFVPSRSNLGVELYRSTEPGYDALPWGTAMPLWPGDPEFREYVQLGEVEFSRQHGEVAKARIAEHPGPFWRHTLDRFLFFWDDTPQPVDKHRVQAFLRDLSYAFLSVCGLLGLGLAIRRQVPGAWMLALVFLLAPLPYYLVTVQARFRHPLEPLIAVLGVYLFRSTQPNSKTKAAD